MYFSRGVLSSKLESRAAAVHRDVKRIIVNTFRGAGHTNKNNLTSPESTTITAARGSGDVTIKNRKGATEIVTTPITIQFF